MAELKEQFLTEVSNRLVKKFKGKEVRHIMNEVLIVLDKYNLVESCTDLVEVGVSDESLLKNYAGCILTEGKSKRTVEEYVRLLRKFRERTGKCFMDVKTVDIRVYLAKRLQEVSPGRCKTEQAYLSAFYNWLATEEFIEKNPMLKIKPLKCDIVIKDSFTDVEVDAMRGACKNKRDRAIMELLLASGIRVSELTAMNVSDIDFNKKEVLVREGKGGKQRVTYITDLCASHLKKYLNERTVFNECLFTSRLNERMTKNAVEKMIKKLGINAGVSNAYPHKFRHTLATALHSKGVPLTTIQKILGHSNINITMRYIGITDDRHKYEYQMKYA